TKHKMRHRQIDKTFRDSRKLFKILAQASEAVQPTQSPFHNPAFGQNFKSSLFSTTSNFGFNSKDLLTPMHQCIAGIAAVKNEPLQSIPQRQALQHPPARDFVLFIGWMHQHPQQPSLRIHRYLSLAAFLALVRVKSTSPLFSAVCTDWLSTITTLGSASRSSSRRIMVRKASLICIRMLRSTKRRQKAYTASQGGKSCGNMRHWHPVRVKYNRAFTISRRLWTAFRPCLFLGSKGSMSSQCSLVKSVG